MSLNVGVSVDDTCCVCLLMLMTVRIDNTCYNNGVFVNVNVRVMHAVCVSQC